MKTEIKKILYKFLQDGISSDDAAQQVLNLFGVSNSNLLSKFDKQLDKLQKIHGRVIKTYDMHSACNGYKFEDGATYRIRLDKATGQATLD